jgi:hypothetical protein
MQPAGRNNAEHQHYENNIEFLFIQTDSIKLLYTDSDGLVMGDDHCRRSIQSALSLLLSALFPQHSKVADHLDYWGWKLLMDDMVVLYMNLTVDGDSYWPMRQQLRTLDGEVLRSERHYMERERKKERKGETIKYKSLLTHTRESVNHFISIFDWLEFWNSWSITVIQEYVDIRCMSMGYAGVLPIFIQCKLLVFVAEIFS